MQVETASPEETEAAGAKVARELGPGDVVLVTGELGSGKTTFIRGACRALGVREPVTSPTFAIGHVYAGRLPGRGPERAPGGAGEAIRGGGGEPIEGGAGESIEGTAGTPIQVAHLDLYRLSSLAGEDPALLDDYLTPDRVAFVEWPEVAGRTLGEVAARVRLEHRGEGRRAVEVEGRGVR